MAYLHYRTRIRTREISNPMATLYYAELVSSLLLEIWKNDVEQLIVFEMVTVQKLRDCARNFCEKLIVRMVFQTVLCRIERSKSRTKISKRFRTSLPFGTQMLFQMVQFQNIIFHKSLCNFKWYFEWLPFENCKTSSKTARFQIVFPTVFLSQTSQKAL